LAEQHRNKVSLAPPQSSDSSNVGETKMNEMPLAQDVIGGGASDKDGLLSKAAKHPFLTGGVILAGAGLAYAAVKTIQSVTDNVAREVHIETSIAIDKSPEELYSFWRDFKNLPLFMRNLDSVTELGERKSHWVASGIGNGKVEWDAEIYNEKENELIAWRSLENADVVNAGSVRFENGPTGHGTYVRVTMNYNPPAGKLGATVAQLFGAEPAQLIKEDLRRLKQIMEAGEIATIDGQTSGRAQFEEAVTQNSPATIENPQKLNEETEAASSQTA
jgi:uncharacterized membrane protein